MAKKSKSGFLSADALKIIAVVSMIIDHVAIVFFGGNAYMRAFGRLAFPIFAFFIAQGARKTSSPLKYCGRLLAFALISEIPFDLAGSGEILEFKSQNVYFTLLLGLISTLCLRFLQRYNIGFLAVVSTIALSMAAAYIESDFGAMGVVVITLMYIFNDSTTASRFSGIVVAGALTSIVYVPLLKFFFLPTQLPAAFAAIPLSLYNGKRGKRINKYAFYLVYPIHFLVIYLISGIMKLSA